MIDGIRTLPKHFLMFLAELSEDGSVLPSDFLTDFEINRLEFNSFGELKYKILLIRSQYKKYVGS